MVSSRPVVSVVRLDRGILERLDNRALLVEHVWLKDPGTLSSCC